MTLVAQRANRAPQPSSLADVLEVVLDKGIVIDAYVRIAVVGIELLTVDARVVIASVDTYLRFAEAVNRLELQPSRQVAGLPGLLREFTGGGDDDSRGASGGDEDESENGASSRNGDSDQDSERKTRRAPARRSSPSSRRPPRRQETES